MVELGLSQVPTSALSYLQEQKEGSKRKQHKREERMTSLGEKKSWNMR